MATILEHARDTIHAINANLSAAPVPGSAVTKFGSVNQETGEVEWAERSRVVQHHSGYPFYSMCLSVDPDDIPAAQAMLKAHGLSAVDFDENGCPKIESSVQQVKIAKAMGLFSGRDGYGCTGEDGKHQQTGRARGEELTKARGNVQRLRQELDQMPDDCSPSVLQNVLQKHGAS